MTFDPSRRSTLVSKRPSLTLTRSPSTSTRALPGETRPLTRAVSSRVVTPSRGAASVSRTGVRGFARWSSPQAGARGRGDREQEDREGARH